MFHDPTDNSLCWTMKLYLEDAICCLVRTFRCFSLTWTRKKVWTKKLDLGLTTKGVLASDQTELRFGLHPVRWRDTGNWRKELHDEQKRVLNYNMDQRHDKNSSEKKKKLVQKATLSMCLMENERERKWETGRANEDRRLAGFNQSGFEQTPTSDAHCWIWGAIFGSEYQGWEQHFLPLPATNCPHIAFGSGFNWLHVGVNRSKVKKNSHFKLSYLSQKLSWFASTYTTYA